MVPRANCSVLWVITVCLVSGGKGDGGALDGISGPNPRCDEDDRLPVGGVGRAFGARTWRSGCFPALDDSIVGVIGPADICPDPSARGVRDSWSVTCDSPVLGVSLVRPVRGVPRLIVKRRCSPPAEGDGITISERCGGLAEVSIEPRVPPLVLLSLRRSRSVGAFSLLTAGLLVRPPAGLADEAPYSGRGLATELPTLEVSTACTTAASGDSVDGASGPGMLSPSLQFAGVGGTGPKAAIPLGGGRRVGGDTIGSLPEGIRWALCDLDADGGGPGGGGGTGMVGSHLTCDEDRDRAEVGVATAGVEAARRAPGATFWEESESVRCGI
jgi:hypothetical protein